MASGDGMADEAALKIILEPGTHRCQWTLSKPPDTSSWDVDGDVELVDGRQPRGGVYGKAPVVRAVTPGGGTSAGFPQRFNYPIVYGELSGGLDIVLVDARLSVSGEHPRQGPFHFKGANAYFDAWAALVGRRAPRSDTLLVDSGVIQVTHLDAFAARSPLASQTMPGDPAERHEAPAWGVTLDKTSTQVWQDDDAEVSVSYNGSAEIGGWYRFGLKFSPVIDIELKHPISLAQFMTEWAWPIKGIISAATGKNETITYLSCSPVIEGDDRPPSRRRFQVFQASVSQEPYASTNDLRDKQVSAIRLGEGESLLALLRKWQQLEHEQNPILNTYEADALGPDQTPRARFLLLIQALEGLYGFENRIASQLTGFEGSS